MPRCKPLPNPLNSAGPAVNKIEPRRTLRAQRGIGKSAGVKANTVPLRALQIWRLIKIKPRRMLSTRRVMGHGFVLKALTIPEQHKKLRMNEVINAL